MRISTYLIILLSLLFVACASGEKDPNETTQMEKEPSTRPSQQDTPSSMTPSTSNTIDSVSTTTNSTSTCQATSNSENNFNDSFIENKHNDIATLFDAYSSISVSEIAQTFNHARDNDPTISKHLTMPTQTKWDNMSASQQALFLINDERCARRIRPFEGIEPKIVNNVAKAYANYIAANDADFVQNPHEADGRTPWERLTQDANVRVNTNADFFGYGENLAYHSVASSLNYPATVHETTAKSVYGWMYEDKSSRYGHRLFILSTNLIENSGDKKVEGLIGVATSKTNYTTTSSGRTFYWTKIHTVLNGFDPNENWDMSNVIYK